MKLLHACIAFISTVASVSAQTYSATDCLLVSIELSAFERYDEYFREDSFTILAQAGRYTGPANIEEYGRFADETSPYIDIRSRVAAAAPQFKGMSDDGTCEFLQIFTEQHHTSATNSRASTYNMAIMVRVFYELSDNKISSVRSFFPQPYLDFFFGVVLNTSRTRNFICATMEDKCPETHALNFDLVSTAEASNRCMLLLETLPVTAGNISYFDGNSQGCRALHAAFASRNSAHCAHISFVPESDENGNIKCQDSSDILISELFDPQDLLSYESFVQSPESMIESLDGYLLISIEEVEGPSTSVGEEEPSTAPSAREEDGATASLHRSLSVMTFASIAYTFLMP
jgi:hypothetical protein